MGAPLPRRVQRLKALRILLRFWICGAILLCTAAVLLPLALSSFTVLLPTPILLVDRDQHGILPAAQALHDGRIGQHGRLRGRSDFSHDLVKLRPLLHVYVDALPEELANGPHISVEVVLCILVRQVNDLREVDQRQLFVLVYHQVKLVKVAVDNACSGESHQETHQPLEDLVRMSQRPQVEQWHCVDEAHDDAVPVLIDRRGHGKALVLQSPHVRELLHRGQPRHVHP
mmetsp:Transcript_89935/g.268311  ORF Transcript_89935/g.268311 Transcript_89935/m.268311 type:complete len:229 (-) Transcript_89935:502-1188(-)